MATLELDGWGNGYAPPEHPEVLGIEPTEAEYYFSLFAEKTKELKRLAEIEGSFQTFGSLTYEEQIEKHNILKQYL